ncbi:hypothetical protein [Oricola nitratireducens]|uniref:hypothetical protein n=1 Tax=Oricola nitratireducens TaxID=2775868 RepID=UPI001868A2BA|nr:hypothetical protein [Oricola nitratireducens]
MPQYIVWQHDEAADLHRAPFWDSFELLVASNRDGGFDAIVSDARTGDPVWESTRTYDSIPAAKRGAVAAAKRHSPPGYYTGPAVIAGWDLEAEFEEERMAEMPPSTVPSEQDASEASSRWREEDGRLVARFERAEHAARCAIVAIDPGQYLGYVRVRELVLRIEYASLMEAKRGLVKRAEGLLEQLLPEGIYAGGL